MLAKATLVVTKQLMASFVICANECVCVRVC